MSGWSRRRPSPSAQQPSIPGLGHGGPRRLPTPTEQAVERAHGRLILCMTLFVAAFGLIGARLIDVTLLSTGSESETSAQLVAKSGGRAEIIDRTGQVLATSLPTISVCAQTRAITDVPGTVKQIAGVLPTIDRTRLAHDLQTRRGCVMVQRHITPKQYSALNRLGIAGVEFSRDERRVYPMGELAAHVVGSTDIDNIGISGLEKSMDQKLRQDQMPLALSIDVRVQNILRSEMLAAMRDFNAIGAAGLVMDIDSGEVIAMSSLPDYDPNHAGKAADAARFNRPTLGVYELGSTFKIFTAAMALESGQVKMTDSFDATKPIVIGRQIINDFHPENRWLSVPEIVMVSSNIGAARMAEKVGAVAQRGFLERLGMFAPPPIELPENGRPLVPAHWGLSTMMTVSFGHGLAVSPLQMVRAMATIANGGSLVKPTLFKQDPRKAALQRERAAHVISATTAAKVRAMMRLVVSEGTAKSANADGYLVGGKTGTAEKITPRGYNPDARLSSFVGVFPLNDPRYIVFVMLDEPKGNKQTYGFATGGWVAAPAVGRIISAAAPLLGLPPLDDASAALADRQILKPLGNRLLEQLVDHDDAKLATVGTADAH